MPIEISCKKCGKKLRVPDTAAGKRVKCPGCESAVAVPDGKAEAKAEVKKTSSAGRSAASNWQVQTEDGETYGPISKSELDQWVAEGRVTSECQLLKEGSDQWQWASDVFPDLDTDFQEKEEEPAGDDEATIAMSSPFNFGADNSPTARVTGKSSAKTVVTTPTKTASKTKSIAAASTAATDEDAGISPRDKLAAGLLAIFGGAYGVHSFYLGNKTSGIIRLVMGLSVCLSLFSFIWGVVDAITILNSPTYKDAKGRVLRNEKF